MKNVFLLLAATLITALIACSNPVQSGASLPKADPENEGVSIDGLARIDSFLLQSISSRQIPGVVALVARNGKIVYHKAFGSADDRGKSDLAPDAIFRLASQTKAITATAVMMLWEEGKFNLDDPISKFIPEFADAQVLDTLYESDTSYSTIPVKNAITIRHLLTHTSGIGYGFANEKLAKIYGKTGIVQGFSQQPITLEMNITQLASLPLLHQPGEQYTYGLSLDVLGYLVEVLSGISLDEFFNERIFKPLGMADTYFYLPANKAERLVQVQTLRDATWINYDVATDFNTNYPTEGDRAYFSGGAGLSGTASDYALFLQMYLNKGELNGKRLLKESTVELIMDNHIGDLWGNSGYYHGLAFGVLNEQGQEMGGRGSAGTFSWGGYFNTDYFADPQEQIIGVILKQTREVSDDSSPKFKRLVVQAVED